MKHKKLEKIIKQNKNSLYGQKYNFEYIKGVEDFQKKVPITTYSDYVPYIDKIKLGQEHVLTTEKVLLLEPSSGSTSAKKLIPYTKGLKQEFAHGVKKWLWDINKNFPSLKYGEMYFSITPQATKKDGIVGFNNDEEYIGGLLGKFVSHKFCVPKSVHSICDMDEFWKVTISHIKKAKKLRFVSVWNPTFLLIMLEKSKMKPRELFPDLEFISCWADGNSEPYANKLKQVFKDVYIQPKGLLATEGIMTIPIEGLGKQLTDVHFFEFIDKNGDIRLSHELDINEQYEIILTTSGGFYRYNIGDIVCYKGNNCFDFVGKSGNISDFFGEKLNETHVKSIISGNGFCILVPDEDRYILYSETYFNIEEVDKSLRENFHYDYCRKLGQLKEPKLVIIKDGTGQYIDNCLKFGMRLGDIKPTYLSNKRGWVFN